MRPIAACATVVGNKHTRWSGHTGITRHSPRSGLRLIRDLPGEPCSIATVTCGTDRRLDISTEMSGQHDFVVRFRNPRQERHPRPPHLTARFVTIASRPSCRVRRAKMYG